MHAHRLLLALPALAVSLADCALVYPAYQGVPATSAEDYNFNGTTTDSSSIASTVYQVDQKTGPTADAPPNLPVANTTVTAIDGDLVNSTVPVSRRSSTHVPEAHLSRRNNSNYEMIFWGTGTRLDERDASVEGTAYMTYTLVDNSTYNIEACLDWCDTIPGCAYVNLYYEFNNPDLDHKYSSNLKCAAYGDVHTAAEKTNFGGQALYGDGGPLTYIQQSSGWAIKSLWDPSSPDGYEPVFGPGPGIGANEAHGYMGFAFLDKYDVDACATLCNHRTADSVGGACQYFNIWRAVVDGAPTTYTCSMYYIETDASTATNLGQSDRGLVVTESRGYKRKSYLPDGGFEDFTCENDDDFCFTDKTSTWIGSSPEGGYDATIFHWSSYAHSGNSVGLLGSAYGYDAVPGVLAPTKPLPTEAGKQYSIQFFHASTYSGVKGEANAVVSVYWNNECVATIRPAFSEWKYYSYTVVGQGQDVMRFEGGSAPSYDFLDDIYVFEV